jgi:hypothetical protein
MSHECGKTFSSFSPDDHINHENHFYSIVSTLHPHDACFFSSSSLECAGGSQTVFFDLSNEVLGLEDQA